MTVTATPVQQQTGPPTTAWTQTFTLGGTESATTAVQAADGGSLFAGQTTESGDRDALVIKVDSDGQEQWRKTYGGAAEGWISDAAETADGYLLAGQTASLGNGQLDAWLLKLATDGTKQWERPYGDTADDRASSVLVDGSDYVFAGGTTSEGSGGVDAWLMRVDSDGNERWNVVYGGSGDDWAFSHVRTDDGGYIMAGETDSAGSGGRDAWLLKTNSDGDAQWNRAYGGSSDDYARDIIAAQDGGYVFVGGTQSSGSGGTDGWIVKVAPDGSQQWQTRVGGSGDDRLVSVTRRKGGYLGVGATASAGRGAQSTWAVQFEEDGTEQWRETYDTDGVDYANAVVGGNTPLIAGASESGSSSSARLVKLGTEVAPSAAFTVTPTAPETELQTSYDGSGSSVSGGSIASYEWDFDGDGRFEKQGQSVTHTFDQVGSVAVTLRVTSASGVTNTSTKNLDVSVARSSSLRQMGRSIDSITAADIDHETMVNGTVTRFNQRVREGRIQLETAEEATERLLLAEEFTESVVGGLGREPYDRASAEYDLADHTAELTLNVLVNLTMVLLSFVGGKLGTYITDNFTFVSKFIDDAVAKLDDAIVKLANRVANLNGTIGKALKKRSEDIADKVLSYISGKGEQAVNGFIDDQISKAKDGIADGFRRVVEWDGDAYNRGAIAHLDDGLGTVYTQLDPDRVERSGLDGSLSGARAALSDGVNRTTSELRAVHDDLQWLQNQLSNLDLVDNLIDAIQAIIAGDGEEVIKELIWALISLFSDAIGLVSNIAGAAHGAKKMFDVTSIHEETLQGIADGQVN